VKANQLTEVLLFRKEHSTEAQKLVQHGLWEEAEAAYYGIVEELPGDDSAHTNRARALMNLSREDEATEHLQAATGLQKVREDRTKRAVQYAVNFSWKEAAEMNQMIIEDFPWDLEAYNRLGKAFLELGKNRKASDAFRCALVISPRSPIASKNLDRLEKLSRSAGSKSVESQSQAINFIEETGKTGVTKLVNVPRDLDFSILVSGHSVELFLNGKGMRVRTKAGEEIGTVEAKIGSRLRRLMEGGNKYEASITSASDSNISVIIREVYRDPSQAHTSSFIGKAEGLPTIPNTSAGYLINDGDKLANLKDWSSDDTESGDEESFTPVIPRLLSDESSIMDEDY
tara:strand:+ start:190 stop:1218 length:1029 start_codon:yes stop_codon:yes gene_type:complete